MNFRSRPWIFAAAAWLACSASAAHAQCPELVARLFRPEVNVLHALGGGVTARGSAGYRWVALAPDFAVKRHRFGTAQVAGRTQFTLTRSGPDRFTGRFKQMFPERGNADVDDTSLEVHRDGSFHAVFHTWGEGRARLQNATCVPGPGGQLLLSSVDPDVGWGMAHWSVVIGPGPAPRPPLYGFVDMHTHPMSHLGFGRKAMHGVPDLNQIVPAGTRDCNPGDLRATSMEQALGHCNSTHGGKGFFDNPCGDYLRAGIVSRAIDDDFVHQTDNVHGDHQHAGAPDFRFWPHHSSVLHQQMWWEWLKRAHEGGLRVIVALAVNNEMLAELLNGDPPFDDRSVADLQIDETIRLVNAHGFMQVARSAAELRGIVAEGKLAVVLGMEVDRIGNFGRPGVVTNEAAVRAEIRRLHAKGVRYVFPVHLVDNAFGGAAVYDMLFNFANRHDNGSLFRVETSSDPNIQYNVWATSGPLGSENAAVLGIRGLLEGIGELPAPCFNDFFKCQPLPGKVRCCGSYERVLDIFRPIPEIEAYKTIPPGHVNARGLAPLGTVAINEMMKLGMLIDLDHMSERSIDATLRIAEGIGYPVVMGHNGLRGPNGNERSASAATIRRIQALGGMLGVGTADTTPRAFAQSYDAVSRAMGGRAMAIGTDVNGFEKLPHHPRATTPASSAAFYRQFFQDSEIATRIRTGNKTWDYVTEGGVSHYGLMPEFLFDVRMQTLGAGAVNRLMDSAETFAQVWSDAEEASLDVR